MIEVSKKFLPNMSCSYSDPKLTTHVGDGFVFMGKHQGEFDVIITDSSDPVGKIVCWFLCEGSIAEVSLQTPPPPKRLN